MAALPEILTGAIGSTRSSFLLVRCVNTMQRYSTPANRPVNMAHKFQIGQVVEYHTPRGIDAPRGFYLVAALLPERDGEFYYHLRHPGEMHVRIAGESGLTSVREAATPEIITYKGYRLDPSPVGRGWRVFVYPPGNKPVLSEYASSLEKGSKERVIKEAKEIVDAHLESPLVFLSLNSQPI